LEDDLKSLPEVTTCGAQGVEVGFLVEETHAGELLEAHDFLRGNHLLNWLFGLLWFLDLHGFWNSDWLFLGDLRSWCRDNGLFGLNWWLFSSGLLLLVLLEDSSATSTSTEEAMGRELRAWVRRDLNEDVSGVLVNALVQAGLAEIVVGALSATMAGTAKREQLAAVTHDSKMNLFVGVSIARIEGVMSESWARMRMSVRLSWLFSSSRLGLLLSSLLEVLVESRDGLLNERILEEGGDELAKVFGTNWDWKESFQLLVSEKLFGLCNDFGDKLIRTLEVWDFLHKLVDFRDDELVSLLRSGASPGLQELEDLLRERLSSLS